MEVSKLTTDHRYLVDFLQTNRQQIYTEWQKQNFIPPDKAIKKEIIENTISFYNILIDYIQNDGSQSCKDIQSLAKLIASQRIKKGMYLIQILSNFSLVRTALINYISKHFIIASNWQPTVDYLIHELQQYVILYFLELQNKLNQPFSTSESHKERLTLLGQMTSSFVHEFRNPLTSIKGFVQLLKSENPTLKYADIILNELEQLNARISQFLLLSRKENTQSQPTFFSIHNLIEEIITFTYPSTVNSNVTIATDIDPTLSLFGQREEIRQVLLNIILNALDVLTETEDPCITITSFQTNKCKKIIIANNGPEIKAEILSEIFKPFITNKQSGTGLGLFVCKEIIEKHNGWLNCSTSKKETRFTITFPITK